MYGVEGGNPRRLDVGLEATRAQSNGEWPGDKRTFLRGLVGMELWVGGGARLAKEVGVRFGRGERMGGDMRPEEGWIVGRGFNRGGPRTPPEALWIEFAAGNDETT
jgi:hypothetical protein